MMKLGSSAQISVRGLETGDRRQWEELWADYNAFYGRTSDTALVPEIVETTWTRLLDESEPVQGLLGLSDGAPVGLAHVVFHPNLIQREPTCYMQDLFTVPEARSAGVAGALIEAVCVTCAAPGEPSMCIGIRTKATMLHAVSTTAWHGTRASSFAASSRCRAGKWHERRCSARG